jgi:hypothetical protein
MDVRQKVEENVERFRRRVEAFRRANDLDGLTDFLATPAAQVTTRVLGPDWLQPSVAQAAHEGKAVLVNRLLDHAQTHGHVWTSGLAASIASAWEGYRRDLVRQLLTERPYGVRVFQALCTRWMLDTLAERGDTEGVHWLLAPLTEVQRRESSRILDTALVKAARTGHADTVGALLAYGAVAETANNLALHEAIKHDHPDVVARLIPVSRVNQREMAFLRQAVMENRPAIARMLLAHADARWVDIRPLWEASQSGDLALVSGLIPLFLKPDTKGQALRRAALAGHAHLIPVLLPISAVGPAKDKLVKDDNWAALDVLAMGIPLAQAKPWAQEFPDRLPGLQARLQAAAVIAAAPSVRAPAARRSPRA